MDFVSIIMSTYNENESYLRGSIESIINQTYDNFEFIIVLDNPENNKIKEIVLAYKNIDNRIIIIENECNLGLTKSLNKALKICKGKYVLRMDADDVSELNRLKEQLRYIVERNYDILGTKFRKIDGNGNVIQKASATSCNDDAIFKKLLYCDCVAHPTWLVKKEVYDNLCGYRDIKTCEDYDFLLRARKRKYKIGNYDNITLSYRINDEGISRTNELKQFLTTVYLQKNYKNIENISQDSVNVYLRKKLTPEKIRKFSNAQNYYRSALLKHRKGFKTSFTLNVFLACISSKYFVVLLKNILFVKIISIFYSDNQQK